MTVSALRLASDRPIEAPTLSAHLAGWAGVDADRQALAALILCLAEKSIPLAERLRQGRLPGRPDRIVGTNESGDEQKALDVAAHAHLVEAMKTVSVAKVLSEEAEEVVALDPAGRFDVAMDPIDGSGSIGIGAPLGALFCIFPAADSMLRPGREVIAAGYVSFGHSVDLGISVGEGVVIATLDPAEGVFRIDEVGVTIPEQTSTIAFNASNLNRWTPGYKRYVEDAMRGELGPRGQEFNMRWIAAAVADLHRILRRGGLFLYPADTRPDYREGYLRLAYEAFTIAFLIEQAGGAATDGAHDILDLSPRRPHDRVPLVFGSRAEVAVLHDYLRQHQDQD